MPLPVPAGRGQLASLQLGEKASNPLSVYGYDKTLWAARKGRGAGWLERMRQAGRRPGEAVWRWELRLRGEALQLRKRGRGEVVVDFRRCATLADQAAIARAWSYGFGNAKAKRQNGHYRLTVPAERFDEDGRGFPLTRTRAVDPLWRLVQEAGGQAPVESLSQVRERKEAARVEWRRKAEDTALRGLAAIVALDQRDDADAAADAALGRARELMVGERWTAAHALQVAATQDLQDPEPPDPGPGPDDAAELGPDCDAPELAPDDAAELRDRGPELAPDDAAELRRGRGRDDVAELRRGPEHDDAAEFRDRDRVGRGARGARGGFGAGLRVGVGRGGARGGAAERRGA